MSRPEWPASPQPLESHEPDPDDPEGWISHMIERGDQVAAVQLYRYGAGAGARPGFLASYSPDGFQLADVAETHGGGRYRATIRVGSGSGVIKKHVTFEVEGEPLTSPPRGRPAEPPPAPFAPPAAAPGTDFTSMAVGLTSATMTAVSSMMAPLLAALTERQPPPETMSATDILDVLRTGMEMGRESQASPPSPYLAAFAPLVAQLAKSQGAAQAAPVVAAAPEPTAVMVPQPDAPAWFPLVAPHVPHLLQLARVRADPDYWAGRVVEGADPDQCERLAELADQPEVTIAVLSRAFPEVFERRGWFEHFIACLPEHLSGWQDAEPGEPAAPE